LPNLPARTILIVDDVQSNRDLLTAYLAHTHHRVLEAADGEQAIALAMSHQPDLILLDLVMAPLDGRDVLAQLKQSPTTQNIPVVLVTASVQEQDVAELQPLVHGFIRKPVSREAIAAQLQRLLANGEGATTTAENRPLSPDAELSETAHERLPELIQLLQQAEDSTWQSLHQTLLLDQIRLFVTQLQTWATDYESATLQAYVSTLQMQVDNFDLFHLPETLAEFPHLKTQLQHLLEQR
jgi:CheY-like chemotaxis protein